MRRQRGPAPAVVRSLRCLLGVAFGALLGNTFHGAANLPAGPPAKDLFDEIYARSRNIEASMKTVTARFTETTSSSLLSRPLVAQGTLAVERPSKIVLRYGEPEQRTVLIDHDRLTVAWPSRGIRQQTDIASAQRRIEHYFVDKSPDELRRNFNVTAVQAEDRPGTWRVTMVPRRKQIQQGLVRLQLWIDRTSLLMAAMQMDFPNGDSKLMAFEDVVVNGPIDPKIFGS